MFSKVAFDTLHFAEPACVGAVLRPACWCCGCGRCCGGGLTRAAHAAALLAAPARAPRGLFWFWLIAAIACSISAAQPSAVSVT